MGGHHPPHPKWVWSASGGWQWQNVWEPGMQGAYSKSWARNTGIAFVGIGVAAYFVFQTSRRLEQRPQAPVRKIPSIHWWGRQELRDMYPNPKLP
eukprot:CAMPEP_0113717994 /NCGR_PEP_ID=MMETSP0038_2-20120614/34905_1 /TAXON_ID=2898 /ORGANISM="Cryptomonas paramecium" /LENGTH=94 /DNA_ID=CAMNT_0000645991 /DNA_START=11 /DNA_END=295 /DNA_ORIENTATION=+ /assembly_acc=CAM_ASM_000170